MASKNLTHCPSNLKEAIDWILRVTGKDGQDSSGGTEGLAKQVQELLEGVINKNSENALNGVDADMFKALNNWLTNNKGCDNIKTLIDSLAEGLATFIGYQHNNANGLIGVDGIAASNEPLERLRDAVLGFLAGFLGQLNHRTYQGVLKLNSSKIPEAIKALNGGVGKGQQGFETAIKGADNALTSVTASSITNVWSKLKNVNELKGNDLGQLSTAFKGYLQNVLGAVAKDGSVSDTRKVRALQSAPVKTVVESLSTQFSTLVNQVGSQKGPINLGQLQSSIDTVYKTHLYLQPSHLTPIKTQTTAHALASAVYSATNGFRRELQKPVYASSYAPAAKWSDTRDKNKCAMTFLGCFPLYYYGLTYLYWQCKQPKDKGGWAEWTFGNGNGYELKYFMAAIGFDINQFNSNSGHRVMNSVPSKLPELSSSTGDSFPKFLNKLQSKFNSTTALLSSSSGHTIPALICIASFYFHCKQRQNINTNGEPPPPTTIRQMLYWLTGLTITHQFKSLLGHFTSTVPDKLAVVVSGTKNANVTLTADDLSGHLIPACILCPNILGLIQGNSSDNDGDPWLHGLFSNKLGLSYPSGLDLFRALCDYVYAVQFQLSFLVQMCISGSVNGGWQNCRYGKDVLPNGPVGAVKSWICRIISGCSANNCQHNSSAKCQHTDTKAGCGSNGKASPLQAFLTDRLEGFRHSTSDPVPSRSPNYPNHYANHPKGFMCHVPMGFRNETLRADPVSGYAIFLVLRIFSATNFNPFRQLCEKLVCLAKRTPKTLGDLFGFYWHFTNQVFNKRNIMEDFAKLRGELQDYWNPWSVVKKIHKALSPRGDTYANLKKSFESTTGLSRSFKALQSSEALFFFLFQAGIPNALDGLASHCHETDVQRVKNQSQTVIVTKHKKAGCSTANDLWSLHQGVSLKPNRNTLDKHPDCRSANCGGYLNSLTLANGAVFAPKFASTYLSWLVYLTEEFYEWLSGFLGEFRRLTCEVCTPSCNPGKTCHSTSTNSCTCKSVVWCSGVLSLLYQYGLNFTSTSSLNGQHFQRQTSDTVRTCAKFSQQLREVLAKDETAPLWNLIKTIDNFLFYVRIVFLLLIGSGWTLAFVITFKILIIKLDLLHIRSHMHLPISHKILPSALLTTSKASARTKLLHYMQ
ncbi:uncharacterized protein BcabD6B2_27410 [Babesia caballi]|uniref:Variant erythrocyte surface antigen-1, alpha subunit n=1 Tax=Babesia caballi TaxID=5871 RepID=A0AAV4LTY9_BABCB|nr:hypothetical protein, conserved [Babesia caballi]